MTQEEKKRIQFDFTPAAADRLDELVSILGASSRAEVVRKALSLYDQVMEAQREGSVFLIRTKDGHDQRLILL